MYYIKKLLVVGAAIGVISAVVLVVGLIIYIAFTYVPYNERCMDRANGLHLPCMNGTVRYSGGINECECVNVDQPHNKIEFRL